MGDDQLRLFEIRRPRRPRRMRRVMMHVIDAGGDEDGDFARFECRRCGLTDWIAYRTVSEAKRGVPCPECND